MNKLSFIVTAAAVAALSGCTTPTAYVPRGANVEATAGFARQDMESLIRDTLAEMRQKSGRFAIAGARRVVNVKNVTVDTTSRGGSAARIAENLGQMLRAELTNDGTCIVYNERLANETISMGGKVAAPEYVLYATLREENIRRDNGDFYRQYTLNLQLVGAPANPTEAGLEIWQGSIPLDKAVDRKNILY